jgi:transcriptional regulator with XRE-family HTH domain
MTSTRAAGPSPLALAELRERCTSGEARAIREGARLSRSELASYLNVSTTQIARWESGQQMAKGHRAERYHTVLKQLEGRASKPLYDGNPAGDARLPNNSADDGGQDGPA